jgi:hypothetical protein
MKWCWARRLFISLMTGRFGIKYFPIYFRIKGMQVAVMRRVNPR